MPGSTSTPPRIAAWTALIRSRTRDRRGFAGPTRFEIGGGQIVGRTVDEVADAVFSLSSSAPHLFADRLPAFDSELRDRLTRSSDGGRFAERTREIAVVIWYPGQASTG